MTAIVFGILCVLFVLATAYIDAEHINDGDYIEDHASRFVHRTIIVALVFCASLDPLLSLAVFLCFTSLFDQALNYFRGLNIWYLGTEAKWDVWWSRSRKVDQFEITFMPIYKAVKISYFILFIGLLYGSYKMNI